MTHRESSPLARFELDLENVLAPISAERPAGEYLRFESAYDELKELRREDDPTLPQGVWKRDLKKADWAQVAARASEILETRSKDLQVAVWLLEAWVHLHGFSGAEQGMRLLRGLVEDFWDHVHPPIEEDGGMDYRLAPLGWLDSHLPGLLKSVPVSRPESDEATPVTWLDWERGVRLAQADRKTQEEAEASGQVTQAKFMVSVSMTATPFLAALDDALGSLAAEAGELAACLDLKAGDDAPSMAPVRTSLEEIRRYLQRVLRERQEDGEDGKEDEPMAEAFPGDPSEGEEQDPLDRPTGGRIRTRAEAYRRLSEAADFLMRTEPHSPAPYLVKRAVTWGNLTLAELLQELLSQNTDLGAIYKLLGIKKID